MCGIFGIIGTKIIDYKKIVDVSKLLRHRGPDDEGYYFSDYKKFKCYSGDDSPKSIYIPHIGTYDNSIKPNVTLLHRRLSIIDIEQSGHQPMSFQGGRFWIVFNGEIYNYKNIRRDLKKNGYIFKSESDTEVIIASYVMWGEQCVNYFKGMWAFAIYDSNDCSLFLSRDRFGIKPLYYHFNDGQFVFSSEIKGIRQIVSTSVDTSIVQRFIDVGQIIELNKQETFFKEIKQLSPGENLLFKDDKYYTSKYWELSPTLINLNYAESKEKFKHLFDTSIRQHLVSDVPVGAALSGGLDSSSIVALAARLNTSPINTFSAVWPNYEFDESKYIDILIRDNNCNGFFTNPNISNVEEIIDREIFHQEIPLPGSSVLAQWYVMGLARSNNIKVILNGQGADEILGGYGHHQMSYVNEKTLLDFLLNPRLYKSMGYGYKYFFKKALHNNVKSSDLQSTLMNDIMRNKLPTLLHIDDRNSMAHSVESRVPFLDHELVEFTLGIKSDFKYKEGRSKNILRESMRQYLPNEILNRKDKIGFATPIESKFFSNNNTFANFANCKLRLEKEFNLNMKNSSYTFNYRENFIVYSLIRFLEIWK